MANPQPHDAHGIIAHNIQENILIRDFSKHQLNIIYLVIRLSWGCGVKAWQYNSYKDFEVIGIYKSDVEKNLSYLVNNNVLVWFKKYNILMFNKDYDKWTITKRIDIKVINKLVHNCLQNTNSVSELLTVLVKNPNGVSEKPERFEAGTSTHDDVVGVSKESLLKKVIKERNTTAVDGKIEMETSEEKKQLENNHISKIIIAYEDNGFGLFTGFVVDEVNSYIDDGYGELILEALKEAKLHNKVFWKYAKGCLNAWIGSGIKTLNELSAHKNSRKQATKASDKQIQDDVLAEVVRKRLIEKGEIVE